MPIESLCLQNLKKMFLNHLRTELCGILKKKQSGAILCESCEKIWDNQKFVVFVN